MLAIEVNGVNLLKLKYKNYHQNTVSPMVSVVFLLMGVNGNPMNHKKKFGRLIVVVLYSNLTKSEVSRTNSVVQQPVESFQMVTTFESFVIERQKKKK